MNGKKKELIRSIKFVLFSISAGVIQVLSFTLMEELLHWAHWASYLLSLVLSVLWNFTLNRKFTFCSAGPSTSNPVYVNTSFRNALGLSAGGSE